MNASTINVRSVMVASRVAGDKFRFSRATVGFALAAVAIAGMGAALQLLVRAPDPADAATAESVGRVLREAVSISPLLLLLLAVVGMASEFRHRTATTPFILTPRRSVWLAGWTGDRLEWPRGLPCARLPLRQSSWWRLSCSWPRTGRRSPGC